MSIREDVSFSTRFVWYSLLSFVVVGIVSFGVFKLQPTWLGMERDNTVNSFQYVEGKRAEILRDVKVYRDNEVDLGKYELSLSKQEAGSKEYKELESVIASLRLQKASRYSSIKEAVDLLSRHGAEDQVPSEARKVLASRE